MKFTRHIFFKLTTLVLISILLIGFAPIARAQEQGALKLTGSFSGGDEVYNNMPIVVGLIDASGYFGKNRAALPSKDQQLLAQTQGVATQGTYSLDLPGKPIAQPFNGNSHVSVFDVRMMSDAAHRGYMAVNEDNIASTLNLDVDLAIQGGTLIVWSDADQQTLDLSPFVKNKITVSTGWSTVDMVTGKVSPLPSKLDLMPTGFVDNIDYSNLSCGDMMQKFLDRTQKFYPFTDLHHIDWASLRAKLIPEAQKATTDADCEKAIRDFGNAIPDGHVDFDLPALQSDWSGSAGVVLEETSDGQAVASVLRPGGPADKAGIKVGAVITQWNGKSISDAIKDEVLQYANSSTAVGLLQIKLRLLSRGPMGSKVDVTFQNPGDQQTQTATLTLDSPKAVSANKATPDVTDNKLPSGVGYIRIDDFLDGHFVDSFDKIVDQLINDKVPAIIIDVRSNPGGLSQISDALAGRFIDKEFVVGTMISSNGNTIDAIEEVSPRPPIYQGCVEILVDVNTASSGDLFSYTFKASNRGVIVGHTGTSGMAGTVSGGRYTLPGGAHIQVPTGALYDDKGNIIVEGTGVLPDITVPETVQSIISPEDDVLNAAVAAQCKVSK